MKTSPLCKEFAPISSVIWLFRTVLGLARIRCTCPDTIARIALLSFLRSSQEIGRYPIIRSCLRCSIIRKIKGQMHSTITSNSSLKTRGAVAPRTRITWASLLGLEEPSLKLLRSAELQRTNSSPISNCQRSKSAIFISRNINSNINSLLRLRVGTHIIYNIGRALHTGSRNKNNNRQ